MTTTISKIKTVSNSEYLFEYPIVTLDNDMVWIDEYSWQPTVATVTPTVGEGVNIQEYEKPNENNRLITLETTEGQGYQRKKTVDALKACAAIPAGRFFLRISHNNRVLERVVRFRAEENAVDFEMIANLDGLQNDDFWYAGTIRLAVVHGY